jgi:hypothetical protein
MIKRFAYIALILIFAPCLLLANTIRKSHYKTIFSYYKLYSGPLAETPDTISKKTKQQQEDEKKKIKEIAKAKRQSKPEKVDEQGEAIQIKPKRERRPEGLERPPEIPRRNGN